MRDYQREIQMRYAQGCWQHGECETLTFDSRAAQVSHEVWKVPGCVVLNPVVFSASSLEGHFPILLSLEQQGSLGIKIDIEYRTADLCRLGLVGLPLGRTSAGHIALDVLENWPSQGVFDDVDADALNVDGAVVVRVHPQSSADISGSTDLGVVTE